jgi:uncharacterized protein (DUF1330 family)
MAAYVIANVDVIEPAGYQEYRALVGATVEKYGGRFLVRGGPHEIVEGDWRPSRVVVLEFPSMAVARRWYGSEEYRHPLALRLKSARSELIFVEGV